MQPSCAASDTDLSIVRAANLEDKQLRNAQAACRHTIFVFAAAGWLEGLTASTISCLLCLRVHEPISGGIRYQCLRASPTSANRYALLPSGTAEGGTVNWMKKTQCYTCRSRKRPLRWIRKTLSTLR